MNLLHFSTCSWLCTVALSVSAMSAGAAPRSFMVCTDYHCDETVEVSLDAPQWQALQGLLGNAANAAAERDAIRAAIAVFETEVGQRAGTWRDLGRNPPQVSNEPGQLDCIAESLNTTTYLQLLQMDGLLRWHTVEQRQQRRPWFFDAHYTAVIRDAQSNERYAVDSWFLDNGQPPYVQPLPAWLRGQDFGP